MSFICAVELVSTIFEMSIRADSGTEAASQLTVGKVSLLWAKADEPEENQKTNATTTNHLTASNLGVNMKMKAIS